MPVSYSLDIATRFTAAQVASMLRDIGQAGGQLAVTSSGRDLIASGLPLASGSWLHVRELGPPAWNPVITSFGFTPSASVTFRLSDDHDTPGQQNTMVQLVSRLLAQFPGDAVLHFQYEVIWLLRRAGELTLNERDDLWPPQRRALLSQHYRRATSHFAGT